MPYSPATLLIAGAALGNPAGPLAFPPEETTARRMKIALKIRHATSLASGD